MRVGLALVGAQAVGLAAVAGAELGRSTALAVGLLAAAALSVLALGCCFVASPQRPRPTSAGTEGASAARRRLHDAIAQWVVGGDASAPAVLAVDVDELRSINDAHGSAAGDEVVRAVGDRLSAAARPEDLVTHLGGGRYAVVVRYARDPAEAVAIAGRMLGSVTSPVMLPTADEVVPRASIGVTVGAVGRDAAATLLDAEAALRRAKRDGGSQVLLFHPSMRRQSRRTYDIEHALHAAIREGAIGIRYQPIAGTGDEGIVGFEALARWTDPRLGPVAPDEFIPVAEATGMIHELGADILERALRDASRWPTRPDGRPCTIGVNVSWMQLARPGFSSLLASVLNATGADPDQVCIELTETAITESMDLVSASLLLIRTMGVHVSIDDFGIGHATLRYLTQLPIDGVKLDRTFVTRVDEDERPRSVVAGVVAMASARGLRLVAEGVETQQQMDALRDLGVPQVQGFLVGPALASEDVPALLGHGARPLRAVPPPRVLHPVIPPAQRRPIALEETRPG